MTNVVLHWDWGRSPNGAYINAEFGQRVWVSTRLYLVAVILSLIIGVALGVYSAARQYKFSDRVITGYSYLVYILPAPSPTSWCSSVLLPSTMQRGAHLLRDGHLLTGSHTGQL